MIGISFMELCDFPHKGMKDMVWFSDDPPGIIESAESSRFLLRDGHAVQLVLKNGMICAAYYYGERSPAFYPLDGPPAEGGSLSGQQLSMVGENGACGG